MQPVKVLFVCLGNICRSPTAEGVFRQVVEDNGLSHVIKTDSAGTAAYHVGEGPDERSQLAAKKRGYLISDLKARQVSDDDFFEFDYILAADFQNLKDLQDRQKLNLDGKARLGLFLDYLDEDSEQEIPDPYYGGAKGFEHVLDLCEKASESLLSELKKDHHLDRSE